jgi:hypothetical protein
MLKSGWGRVVIGVSMVLFLSMCQPGRGVAPPPLPTCGNQQTQPGSLSFRASKSLATETCG